MDCLYCGDCCLRMSPISVPDPCPYLIQDGTFYFCGSYNVRPVECKRHDFPARFCPIGLEKLGISRIEQVRERIDNGWDKIKVLKQRR